MTKEETIIDVSKQFRNLQVQYEKVIKCHKQLQKELREKTVESVRLKAQYDKVVEQNRELQAELREQTAECEELKEQLEKNRKLTLEYISYGEKYLKALDEIENFAKRHCNTCEDNGQQLCSSNYCYRHYLLDIISRAKEGE